jgi:hypothetical protein
VRLIILFDVNKTSISVTDFVISLTSFSMGFAGYVADGRMLTQYYEPHSHLLVFSHTYILCRELTEIRLVFSAVI